MTADLAYFISAATLGLSALWLLLWDTYAYLRFGHDATLSHVMWKLSLKYKWFALVVMLAANFLMWHFFVG